MYKNKVIKSFTAGIMLLLFAFSVTPKQLLHDAITGHKHRPVKYETTVNIQSPKSNFLCNWHSDVVESPFINQPDFQITHPNAPYSSHINYYIPGYFSAEYFFSPLRGPPSLI